jgi:YesN/AraC family two-component response regulator
MSHLHYAFNRANEQRAQEQMRLHSIASAKYGGDWHSIPHAHTYTELFYIIGGNGQFQIEDEQFPVRSHQLVIVNPNIIHTERSYDAHPLEYIVLGIEGLEISSSEPSESRYCIYSFSAANKVRECMQHILQEMQDRAQEYSTACLAYMNLLVVQLMRHAGTPMTQVADSSPSNRQCAIVRRYIDSHYKEPLTLDRLAAEVNVNKYYLAHAYKQTYGISPISYMISRRIQTGKRLLTETDLSLSQISAILGFSSASYFSQSFHKAEGISPMEYRKRDT